MKQTLPTTFVLAIAVCLLVTSTDIAWAGSEGARIVRIDGAVRIEASGKPIPARIGATIPLPAKVATGSDGSLRIEQPSATLDIGPNSTVLLPAADASRENVIQNVGRVLYSVKPRKSRTFSVQTPYLVSVVKGTLFSVAIEGGTTEVALLEGSVELVADGIESVLLQPNEIARRSENARSIDVTKVDTTAPQANALPNAALAAPAANERAVLNPVTLDDLSEIASVSGDLRAATPVVPPDQTPSPQGPTVPGTTPPPDPTPNPAPDVPGEPAPETPAPPTPEVPGTPNPEPDVDPMPDDDDDHCGRKKCDSPDDHDNGGGNDDKDKDRDRGRGRDDKPGRSAR